MSLEYNHSFKIPHQALHASLQACVCACIKHHCICSHSTLQHFTIHDELINVYFQCPWGYPGTTQRLIHDFIISASKLQNQGNHLFIGLTYHDDYYDRYHLDNIFKDPCIKSLYSIQFNDYIITNQAIMCGYYHTGHPRYPIHHKIRNKHFTLCLERMNDHNDMHDLEQQLANATLHDDRTQHN